MVKMDISTQNDFIKSAKKFIKELQTHTVIGGEKKANHKSKNGTEVEGFQMNSRSEKSRSNRRLNSTSRQRGRRSRGRRSRGRRSRGRRYSVRRRSRTGSCHSTDANRTMRTETATASEHPIWTAGGMEGFQKEIEEPKRKKNRGVQKIKKPSREMSRIETDTDGHSIDSHELNTDASEFADAASKILATENRLKMLLSKYEKSKRKDDLTNDNIEEQHNKAVMNAMSDSDEQSESETDDASSSTDDDGLSDDQEPLNVTARRRRARRMKGPSRPRRRRRRSVSKRRRLNDEDMMNTAMSCGASGVDALASLEPFTNSRRRMKRYRRSKKRGMMKMKKMKRSRKTSSRRNNLKLERFQHPVKFADETIINYLKSNFSKSELDRLLGKMKDSGLVTQLSSSALKKLFSTAN